MVGFLLTSLIGIVLPAWSVEYTFVLLAVQIAFNAVWLFLFLPRICGRAYRGFLLIVVEIATGGTTTKLTPRRRAQATIFLWWRQILAGMFAALLAGPLNMLLGTMGIQVGQWIAVFAGVLIIGPILLKMLIGNSFDDFRIEARRAVASRAGTPVPTHGPQTASVP